MAIYAGDGVADCAGRIAAVCVRGGVTETLYTRGSLDSRSRADKCASVVTALLLHGVVIAVLLQYAPAREALTQALPLMVSLITPPAPKPDVLPKPLPVKPVQRAEPRPTPLPPVLAIAPDAPAIATTPPTLPVAPAPVDPVPAPVVAQAAPPAPPAPVRAAPVIPPNFNADYLNNPAPAYPAIARRQGHQGKVVLRVYVNAAGGAEQVEIRSSSNYSALDQAALNAVRRWRFVPARQGDQPVAAWVLVPLTFTLEG